MKHHHLRSDTACALILLCSPLFAQSTTRVSVDSSGAQAGAASQKTAISADGRYVAFLSSATNLVAGDTNGVADVFVHDRLSGATERMSIDSSGVQANGVSEYPAISGNGRYVAFESDATNLVPGDANATRDVFVHDRVTGVTSRVSVDVTGADANFESRTPALSADGRFIAFYSQASNLIPNDTNFVRDVFVRDMQLGTTECVSVDSSGVQGNHDSLEFSSISADGRYVAFASYASNLVPGDTNSRVDIFVHDRLTGATVRASVDSGGAQGTQDSDAPSISADGRFVAFTSAATLVPTDANLSVDVYEHDMQSGQTNCLSVAWNGSHAAVGISFFPSISADGRFVVFHCAASLLVPNDTNLAVDVFLYDRLTGTNTRASLETGGGQANNGSYFPAISADGRYIAFQSSASNLIAGDTNALDDIFVRDTGSPMPLASCFGQGGSVACPCGNSGLAGHGCENSAGTGGAVLTSGGVSSLGSDSLVLATASELPSALSIFLQGSQLITPTNFGDGLRCAGGMLLRLYSKSAVGGSAAAPVGADPTISARSSALGDTIPLGTTRTYQTYYRDPSATFCASPSGNTWNVTNSLSVVWGQ